MSNQILETYNPMNEIIPLDEVKEDAVIDINCRQYNNEVTDWINHHTLVQNLACRDNEVAQAFMHASGWMLFVALRKDKDAYSADELEAITARLEQLIGRVAAFDFRPDEIDIDFINTK
jgi:hypothetical protein